MAGGYSYVGGGQDIGTAIKFVNEIAREVAKDYGLTSRQVSARMACLLKNQYQLQIVLKVSESQYTMFTMTGELDIMNTRISYLIARVPGMPKFNKPLEIVWENPTFSSF